MHKSRFVSVSRSLMAIHAARRAGGGDSLRCAVFAGGGGLCGVLDLRSLFRVESRCSAPLLALLVKGFSTAASVLCQVVWPAPARPNGVATGNIGQTAGTIRRGQTGAAVRPSRGSLMARTGGFPERGATVVATVIKRVCWDASQSQCIRGSRRQGTRYEIRCTVMF